MVKQGANVRYLLRTPRDEAVEHIGDHDEAEDSNRHLARAGQDCPGDYGYERDPREAQGIGQRQ